jgi:superoxide dismutase, Cu-Zn family
MISRALTFFLFLMLTFSVAGFAENGSASLKGTAESSAISGKASFQDTTDGLKIQIELSGVPTPGKHGLHIHQFGACGDFGKEAGDHYNPDGLPHGSVVKDGLLQAHAGDLGNIQISEEGKGDLEVLVPGVKLSGAKYTVGGRSVVLHEKEDDFGQPAGNAGSRIACGAIQITKE